jgi:hypothetical protein
MPDSSQKHFESDKPGAERRGIVPQGAPAWVTDELIQDTLDTFQSHYQKTLTPEDALEILVNVTNLLLFLQE